MRRELPWIGQSPELISGRHHRAIGKARLLLDFYVHHQTDVSGRVHYGKTLTYKWIAKRILDCPSESTLKRYSARLREGGYITTRTIIRDGAAVGFAVTMRNQAKFRTRENFRPAEQIGLFDHPIPMRPRTVEKSVEIKRGVGSILHPGGVRSDTAKDLRLKKQSRNETVRTPTPRAPSQTAAMENKTTELQWQQRRLMAARRILRDIDALRAICVGNQGITESDRRELVWRDRKLEELLRQLQMTGWQEERAG